MFNIKSNTTLWIVFAVLLIAVILIFSSESTKKERSFRKEIVTIDTSSITSISLYPKSKNGQEVKLLLDGDNWKVSGENTQTYSVPQNKIDNLINQLLAIKPKRVASKSKSKWREYQVDSAATRVVVNEDGSEALDLIIGKFAFQQPRSMSTFVRLNDENEVYEVDGFLDMTFNKDVNSFRNETIVKSDKNNWQKLTFFYTEGESFELIKVENSWMLEGSATDSAKTEKAMNSLARLTNTSFVDKSPDEILPQQTSKMVIEVADSDPIEIIGYKNATKYIVHSSQNPENYFDGNSIGEKIFLMKQAFFE